MLLFSKKSDQTWQQWQLQVSNTKLNLYLKIYIYISVCAKILSSIVLIIILIIINAYWTAKLHITMIFEDWSNGCWKSNIKEIHLNVKYTLIIFQILLKQIFYFYFYHINAASVRLLSKEILTKRKVYIQISYFNICTKIQIIPTI